MENRDEINSLKEKIHGLRTLLISRETELQTLKIQTRGLPKEIEELISQVESLKQALKSIARFL